MADATPGFALSPLVFDVVDAVRTAGPAMRQICAALDVDMDAQTFAVAYTSFLCERQHLPVAETLFTLHGDGVLDRLATELEEPLA